MLKKGDRVMIHEKVIEGRPHAVSCATAATVTKYGVIRKKSGGVLGGKKVTPGFFLTMDEAPGVSRRVSEHFVFPAPEVPLPTMFHEKPDVEFPAELIALGFEDRSYRNDLMARATRASVLDDSALVIWVGHADPEQRETGMDYDPRFVAQYHEDAEAINDDDGQELYAGESLEECLAAVNAFLEARR